MALFGTLVQSINKSITNMLIQA